MSTWMNTLPENAHRGVGRFPPGSIVGLDTGPLIYYIEEHPTFLPRVAPFFEAADRGEFRLVTSLVTLIEVLVHPVREGRLDFGAGISKCSSPVAQFDSDSAGLRYRRTSGGVARPIQAPHARRNTDCHSASFRRLRGSSPVTTTCHESPA